MIAERVKQGMGIIKRMIGSDKQNAHFPLRMGDSLLVQKRGFGEKKEYHGRNRCRRVNRISEQRWQAAVNNVFTVLVHCIDEMNEALGCIMTHASNKVLVGVK